LLVINTLLHRDYPPPGTAGDFAGQPDFSLRSEIGHRYGAAGVLIFIEYNANYGAEDVYASYQRPVAQPV
jgi:hypothetical protein